MKKILSITMLIVSLVSSNTKAMKNVKIIPGKITIKTFPNFTIDKDMEKIAAFTADKRRVYRILGRSGKLSSWAEYKLPKKNIPYTTHDLTAERRLGNAWRELDTLDPKIKNKLLKKKKFLSELKSTMPFRGYTKKEREKKRPKKIYFTKDIMKKEKVNVPHFPRFKIIKVKPTKKDTELGYSNFADKAIALTVENSTGYVIKLSKLSRRLPIRYSYTRYQLPPKKSYTLSDFIKQRPDERVEDYPFPEEADVPKKIQNKAEKVLKEYFEEQRTLVSNQ